MKKISFLILIFCLAFFSVQAQDDYDYGNGGGGDNNFIFSLGIGTAFGANGNNISFANTNKPMPTIGLNLGYNPGIGYVGVEMRALNPYSPGFRDSIRIVRNDSSFYWRTYYRKSATISSRFGLYGNDGDILFGGMFSGLGLTFVETSDRKLYTPLIIEFGLEGGVKITEVHIVSLSALYSHCFSSGMTGSNGFSNVLELKYKFRF